MRTAVSFLIGQVKGLQREVEHIANGRLRKDLSDEQRTKIDARVLAPACGGGNAPASPQYSTGSPASVSDRRNVVGEPLLPAGVVAAPRAGVCARCGAAYPAGTHARRYAGGLRPTACGCHPVQNRAQTAPVQPIPEVPCEPVSCAGGADAAATHSSTSPSATTAPGPASAPSSPPTAAAAAAPASPRSSDTANAVADLPSHGDIRRYRPPHKCRCADCRAANTRAYHANLAKVHHPRHPHRLVPKLETDSWPGRP